MNELLILFIALNIANVMLQTLKTLCTVNSGKYTAAIVNAIAYGFYTIVIIYTMCDLPMTTKAIIVGITNLIGVFGIKYFEELRLKDKLWKIEFTVKSCCSQDIINQLEKSKVPFNYTKMPQGYIAFYAFCNTKQESEKIRDIISRYGAKYFVTESKSLLL